MCVMGKIRFVWVFMCVRGQKNERVGIAGMQPELIPAYLSWLQRAKVRVSVWC